MPSASSAWREPTWRSRSAKTRGSKILLADFPEEIQHVWSRIGTAEVATDPMGVELSDIFISLKPRDQWHKAETQAQLTEEIDQRRCATYPARRCLSRSRSSYASTR